MVRKIPWSGKWQPTPVFLPGKDHGQRNLVGCSPWGCKESEMTKRLSILPARMILRDCQWRLTLMAEHFRIGTGRRRGRGCNFSQPAMDPFRSQTSEGLEQISGEMHLKASYFECASKPPCHPQAMTVPPSLIPHIHSFFKQIEFQ